MRIDDYHRKAVRQGIDNWLLKMFIEVDPSLYDSWNHFLDSNVLQKVLAPVLERCPTHCIKRDDSLADGDAGSCCRLILKAKRLHFWRLAARTLGPLSLPLRFIPAGR
jgi:hypothetical protein